MGDILEVRSGELIPADGIIVDGFGALDKAPLTGESAPVEVEKETAKCRISIIAVRFYSRLPLLAKKQDYLD